MAYSLYLDDQHDGPYWAEYDVWVRSIPEMFDVIKTRGYPNQISLDFNLVFDFDPDINAFRTGMDALKMLIAADMRDNFINTEFKMLMHSGDSGKRDEMCKHYDAYVIKKGGEIQRAYTEHF